MRYRCYGNSCCLETDEKINFDYNYVEMMMQYEGDRSLSCMRDCNFKTSTPGSKKTAASLLNTTSKSYLVCLKIKTTYPHQNQPTGLSIWTCAY